jgi:hypothetical protein
MSALGQVHMQSASYGAVLTKPLHAKVLKLTQTKSIFHIRRLGVDQWWSTCLAARGPEFMLGFAALQK